MSPSLALAQLEASPSSSLLSSESASESTLAKQQCYELQNQRLLMKQIRRLRESSKKDVKKPRGALTRVMQHLQTFAWVAMVPRRCLRRRRRSS